MQQRASAAGTASVPSATAPFTIPVLLVHYFPVKDGAIDIGVAGDVGAPSTASASTANRRPTP